MGTQKSYCEKTTGAGAGEGAAVGGDDRPSFLIGGGGGDGGHSECNAASNSRERESARERDGGSGSAEVSGVNEFGE